MKEGLLIIVECLVKLFEFNNEFVVVGFNWVVCGGLWGGIVCFVCVVCWVCYMFGFCYYNLGFCLM